MGHIPLGSDYISYYSKLKQNIDIFDVTALSDDVLYTGKYYLKKDLMFVSLYDEIYPSIVDLYNRICEEILNRNPEGFC